MAGWPFCVGRIPQIWEYFLQWQDNRFFVQVWGPCACHQKGFRVWLVAWIYTLRWARLSSMVFYSFCVCWIFHHYCLVCWFSCFQGSMVPPASHLPSVSVGKVMEVFTKMFTLHSGVNSLHVEIDMHNLPFSLVLFPNSACIRTPHLISVCRSPLN